MRLRPSMDVSSLNDEDIRLYKQLSGSASSCLISLGLVFI